MPTPPTPDSVVRARMRELADLAVTGDFYVSPDDPTDRASAVQEAARLAGVHHERYFHAIAIARTRWGLTWRDFVEPVEAPAGDDDELPEGGPLVDAQASAFEERRRVNRARHNFVFAVPAEPFAIAFVGDPHIDDPGADTGRLKADLEMIRAAGVRAINVGDLLNMWPTGGRLGKKNLDSRPMKESLAMARWFIRDTGVKFDAHIFGNHDEWGGHSHSQLVAEWTRQAKSRLVPWGGRFTYSWGEGSISALVFHDFTGHSMYNPLHGLMRRALEDGQDDVYVAGHKHTSAKGGVENGFRGRHYNFMRVRGYKFLDEYAFVKGFPEQQDGCSGIAVINPHAETAEGRCRTFHDMGDGVRWLEKLREDYT